MSELMNIIKSRRSTRAFKPELPPVEQIRRIVEAAEWAPSGMGRYNWHFSVVYNPEKTLKLARAIACDVPAVRALLTEYGTPEDHIVTCSAAIGYIAKETQPHERREGVCNIVK